MLAILAFQQPLNATKEMIQSQGAKLLMFTVSNCSYCEDADPVFREAASKLYSDTAKLQFENQLPYIEQVTGAYVDCVTDSQLCKDFNITGYPTFVLQQDGYFYTYPQNISTSHLLRWTLAMLQRSLIKVDSVQELVETMPQLNLTSYFVVRSPRQLDFESVFAEFKGRVLAGWFQDSAVSISVNYSGEVKNLSDFSPASVRRFILQYKNKRWQLLSRAVFRELSDERPMGVLAMIPEESDALITAVGKQLRGLKAVDFDFNLGYLDATRNASLPFLGQFGLGQDDLPAAIFIDYIGQRHKVYRSIKSSQEFLQRAMEMQSGKVPWDVVLEKESDSVVKTSGEKIFKIFRENPLYSCMGILIFLALVLNFCRCGSDRIAKAKAKSE